MSRVRICYPLVFKGCVSFFWSCIDTFKVSKIAAMTNMFLRSMEYRRWTERLPPILTWDFISLYAEIQESSYMSLLLSTFSYILNLKVKWFTSRYLCLALFFLRRWWPSIKVTSEEVKVQSSFLSPLLNKNTSSPKTSCTHWSLVLVLFELKKSSKYSLAIKFWVFKGTRDGKMSSVNEIATNKTYLVLFVFVKQKVERWGSKNY